MSDPRPNTDLGQHWLFDQDALGRVVAAGDVTHDDTVLEIGPGLGTLTEHLCERAERVVAVETDPQLAAGLSQRVPARNLEVVEADILTFDLSTLPADYKVVANIPYYITSQLLRKLCSGVHAPALAALLVQKEVAQRVSATPGKMSILAFSVQYYASVEMLGTVPKELFEPSPKVDSAILRIVRRPHPYFMAEEKALFRLVKAGFGERRKQLANALAGGLQLDREEAAALLHKANVSPEARAQELSLDDWQRLYEMYEQG